VIFLNDALSVPESLKRQKHENVHSQHSSTRDILDLLNTKIQDEIEKLGAFSTETSVQGE